MYICHTVGLRETRFLDVKHVELLTIKLTLTLIDACSEHEGCTPPPAGIKRYFGSISDFLPKFSAVFVMCDSKM